MLKRSSRIGKILFKELSQKKALLRHFSYFSLRVGTLPVASKSQFACVVSSRNFKKATERNRMKRRYYTALSHLYKNIKPGYFGIFTVKKGAEKLSVPALRSEIEKALEEVSLFRT